MVFFKFAGRKIQITVEKEITSWDLESDYWSDPDVIARNLRYDCERKLTDLIMKSVEMRMENGLIDQFAEKVIAQFDLTEMYQLALKNKVKEIMFEKNKP